ncbi:MAG: hypothetical protein JWR24_832, partial [Actinoallomurus sp.]|nr:hypothetical protein [Actinoallomurus sp.]
PKPLMPAGFAPRGPAMRTGEEVAHGLGEIPQRLLLHRLRPRRQPPERFTRLGQLPRLLPLARRTRTPRPPMLMLVHRKIPHKTGMRAVLQQHPLLGGRGLKTKPHTNTLTTTTDTPRRERRFLPGPKAEVSTPRMR